MTKTGVVLKSCFCIGIVFILLIALPGCGLREIAEVSARSEQIQSREELYQRVEQGLKRGETEITFETSELAKEDLESLNKEHDGYYGNVTGYKIRTIDLLDRSYVTLYCEIFDNYYVERALLYGEQIPEDRKRAVELMEACRKILPKIGGSKVTAYRKEKRIHDYLVSNVAYGYPEGDQGEDSAAYSSYGALIEKKAVCNGYAQAMKLLCDLSGIDCEMVSGTAEGENHAWNLVKIGKSWYHVDATWDDPTPDAPGRVLYHYFNVNDSFMALDHNWDQDRCRKADGKDYNYYRINDLVCENYTDFADTCQRIFSEGTPERFQLQVEDYDPETYSESALQFLFTLSGSETLNMQTVGEKPWVTLYFDLTHE